MLVDLRHIFTAFASLVRSCITMNSEHVANQQSYNSVVFSSLSAQMYGIFQFTPSTAAAMANNTFVPQNYMTSEIDALSIYQSALRNPDLQRLDPLECINAYSPPFQSSHSNVFLILAEGETQEFKVRWEFSRIERSTGCGPSSGNGWIYQQFRDEDAGACFWQNAHIYLPRLQNNASDWRPWGGRVDYCMSEPAQPECRLQFSVYLLAIVMAFNAVKCVVILVAARGIKEKPLLTIGDAVATFLEREDESTKGIGWVEQQDILRAKKDYTSVQNPTARPGQNHRWFYTVKRSLLIAATLSLSIAIIVLVALLAWGYTAILGSKSISSILSIRLGTLDPRMLIQSGTAGAGAAGVFQNVFLANAPQIIISLVYFSYNAAITSMLLASEWSGYSIVPKGLRVSSEPMGEQRSTYYFSLPLRYAAPLLVMSTIIHWLASQSIFVVVVEAYNMFGFHSETTACYHFPGRRGSYTSRPRPDQVTDPRYCGEDFITCGYSVLGILLTLTMAIVFALALVGLGMKRIGGEMPVVGSNSIAIAANSQPRREWAHEDNILVTLQSRLKWSMAEGWRSTDHELVGLEQDTTIPRERWSREWHQ